MLDDDPCEESVFTDWEGARLLEMETERFLLEAPGEAVWERRGMSV